MKQLQYFTLASFLLVKALSPAELTIKDIKPHIDQLENEFIALTNEVDNLIGEYKKSIGDEFNFRDDSLFGEIREGGKDKEERAAKRHERRTEEKAYFEQRKELGEKRKNKEKEEKEKAKTEKLNKESEKKEQILKNLQEILEKKNKNNNENIELKENNESIKIVKILPKDIKDGVQKKVKEFSVILKTGEELNNIKNLKTFNQIKEFTDNFNYSKTLVKKDINITYLYSIFLSILTQKEKNILELAPILDLNKDEITKLKENKADEKKIDIIYKKITNIIYKYSIAFENIKNPDIDKFDEFILKNQLSFDYTDTTETKEISKKKEELKKSEKSNPNDKKAINELKKKIEELIEESNKNYFNENKIVKKEFKDKSLNDMKLSRVFSSKKDENKVAVESPKLLALLNRFKGTEEENKNMSVRKAVNIIIDFLRLRKTLKYITTTEKREIDYKSTKDARKSEIERKIEALEQQKTDLIVNNIDTFKKIDEIYNKDISPADAFEKAKALIQKDINNNTDTKKAKEKLNDYNILSKEIKALENTIQSTDKEIKARPEKLDKKPKDESDKRAKEIKTKFEKKAEENKNKFDENAKEERKEKIEQIRKDFSADNESEKEDKNSKKIDKNIFIIINTTYDNSRTPGNALTEDILDQKHKEAKDSINKQLKQIENQKEQKIYKEIEKNLYIYNNLKFELAKSNLNKEEMSSKSSTDVDTGKKTDLREFIKNKRAQEKNLDINDYNNLSDDQNEKFTISSKSPARNKSEVEAANQHIKASYVAKNKDKKSASKK